MLKESKQIARRYKLFKTGSLCLLMSTLDDESTFVRLLGKAGVEKTQIVTGIEAAFEDERKKRGFDWTEEEQLPEFDVVAMRIIKLLVLEDKLAKGKRQSDLLLVLAILHDRENEAKSLMQTNGVTYHTIVELMEEQKVTADYTFPEEEAPQPNEEYGKRDNTETIRPETGKKSSSDTPVVDNFGTDLTDVALKGGLDPVIGREAEIQRMIQILCRRKENNPIIIGEPGVGKSALVEGLADRIAHKRVPRLLVGKRIVALNMASIVAGTQYRGQFEERLRRLIQELDAHPEIILFIDEIHTIIGAGSAPGSLDAANILKPALARGSVQCIGATTISEYKKSIEKDGALGRRFKKIQLEPTTKEETLQILRNIKDRYEQHHNVTYTDEALKACVELTIRYVTDKALPNKAIDALDEAGARMHLAGSGVPKLLEEKEKEIELLRAEKLHAAQEQNYEHAASLRDRIDTMSKEVETMTREWQSQQKEHPEVVDEAEVAQVVSMISGVPATRVASSESARLKGLKDALCSKVIAQDKAVEQLARAITRSRLGLKGTDRPIGTFMFVGPTGVGKTHLVKCLAEWMFGSQKSLIRVDMSEYGEKHSVSRLVGAPPGYVGYEEGGQLTERVRRHPYSVILLDEIEKAHPDVFNTLLQVMDEGRMTDGNGTTVDFRNTIIVLTSNSGTRQLREFGRGVGYDRIDGELTGSMAESIVQKVLKKQFSPEFLNRIDDIIMFNPLTKEDALAIARLEINDLAVRMESNGITLSVSQEVQEYIVRKGFDAQYGARSLKRRIQHDLEDNLCDYLMDHPESRALQAVLEEDAVKITETACEKA